MNGMKKKKKKYKSYNLKFHERFTSKARNKVF